MDLECHWIQLDVVETSCAIKTGGTNCTPIDKTEFCNILDICNILFNDHTFSQAVVIFCSSGLMVQWISIRQIILCKIHPMMCIRKLCSEREVLLIHTY